MSLPEPANTISSPEPASMISLPAPASITSSKLEPLTVSPLLVNSKEPKSRRSSSENTVPSAK